MLNRKLLAIALFATLLAGCQTTATRLKQNVPNGQHLLNDQLFPTANEYNIVTEEEIFAIDEKMAQMVAEEISSKLDFDAQAKALVSWVYSNTAGGVNYDAAATIPAIDAFHRNRANCLSLTILTQVLAEEAGLKAEFQQIQIPEYWYRQGEYNLLAGHVNLRLKGYTKRDYQVVYGSLDLEIDFDPYSIRQHFRKSVIERNTILAMYYNNLAGQALVDKEYDKAYAFLRASIQQDEYFSSAWANLGLLYKFNEHLELAEATYRHALLVEPRNMNLMDNLAILLAQTDRKTESNELKAKIQRKREDNPYYYAMLADQALYQDKLSKAEKYFKRAIRLNDKEHEFYFGLAKVYFKLGDVERSKRLMKKAIKHNNFYEVERRYVAKLAHLRNIN